MSRIEFQSQKFIEAFSLLKKEIDQGLISQDPESPINGF